MSTPAANAESLATASEAVGDVFWRFSTLFYSVWGRVVADIPTFNRELVAALVES